MTIRPEGHRSEWAAGEGGGAEGAKERGAPLRSPPMTTEIEAIRTAILEGAPGDEIGALPIPEAVRGALVREEDQNMFDGLPSEQKDPSKSIRVEDFPLPEIAPDEALVGVMASSINFNTVWTS